MKNKSLYSGHCQACGRLQKLPNGKLSQYGYKIDHGYFSGVCVGAKHEPFELSCELVKTFIEGAKRHLESVEAFQACLRLPVEQPTAWIRCSYENPKGRYYPKVHVWEVCPMAIEKVNFQDSTGFYVKYSYTDKNGVKHGSLSSPVYGVSPHDEAGAGKSLDELLLLTCSRYNQQYAEWIEYDAKNMRSYISWQTERVQTWKKMDLLPNDAKDKAGFKPEDPKY